MYISPGVPVRRRPGRASTPTLPPICPVRRCLMPTRLRSASALALCALLVIAVPAVAADPAPASVDWSVPPLPTNRPQTDEEAAFGRANGRPAPAPELLQPT